MQRSIDATQRPVPAKREARLIKSGGQAQVVNRLGKQRQKWNHRRRT